MKGSIIFIGIKLAVLVVLSYALVTFADSVFHFLAAPYAIWITLTLTAISSSLFFMITGGLR